MRLLVSGLTGQLGAGLAEVSAARSLELVPLLRAGRGRGARDRLRRLFPDRPELASSVQAGDVTLPAWGLEDAAIGRLAGEVDGVLNLAGLTDWAASESELFAANSLGPLHGWELARELGRRGGRCRLYCHVSSIHVAGARVGHIAEAPLGPDASRTRYEHSKWVAEQSLLATAAAADGSGPATLICRVGGLVGSLASGSAPARRSSLYMLADHLDDLPAGRLPIARGGRVDMLPRDVAADALASLVVAVHRLGPPEPLIVHVCAGELAPLTETVLSMLASLDAGGSRRVPRPLHVPLSWITWLTENLDRAAPLSPAWQNAVVGLRYLSLDRVFERARLASLIGPALPAVSVEDLVRIAFDLPATEAGAAGSDLARFQG